MPQLTKIRVSRWVLGIDLDATRQAFANLAASDVPETCCDCGDCRNFAAAFPAPFPPEALDLFEQLGMNARYPSEVYRVYQIQPGLHSYGGWFHYIGRLLDGESALVEGFYRLDEHGNRVWDFEPFGKAFEFRFSTRRLPEPDVFEGLQIVALEFFTNAPWVLDEPEYI
jgi:hypothetical protein